MYTLKNVTNSQLFGFILFLILLLFGCATKPAYEYEYDYEYKELENNYNSIIEAVKPGMSILIKAKGASGEYILIGYEEDDTLVCIDESGEVSSKTKIAINDIDSIHLRERVWDTDYSYTYHPPPKTNTQIFFEEIAKTGLYIVFLFGIIAIVFF